MEKYTLKPYANEDYNFVYTVKKVVYQKYVELNFGTWDDEQQKEFFVNFMKKYCKNILIICQNDKNIGFFHGETIDNGDYELGNICLLPEFQGKGIGTAILKDIIKNHDSQNICLQYFKQNPVGNLYTRLGFEKCGETAFHIQMIFKNKGEQK